MRAVTRVATPDNEQTLLDVALAGTAEHVERIVRGWRRVDRAAEEAEDERRDASRSLRTWVEDDGMVLVRGRLTPEIGAVLRRALDAACDEARRTPAPDGGEEAATEVAAGRDEQPTLPQRQADAIALVAEAALAGGLDKGTAGDRYQVVLHVDAAALAERRDVPAGTPDGAAGGSEPRALGGDVPAGTPAGAPSGAETLGRDVPAGRPAGPAFGTATLGRGAGVPAGTPTVAASGTGTLGRDVPAGTPTGVPAEAGPHGCGADAPAGTLGTTSAVPGACCSASPRDAGAPRPTERNRAPRWRRTVGPCPGARLTPSLAAAPASPTAPAAGSQTVLDEAGGIHVSAETARRMACDAAKVTMRHGPGGQILDVGRRTRTVSPALRRALAARDRQCRFPGCGNRRCDAHHVAHWADGGRTALDNLVLLCRRHHRAVHEEGFRVTLDAAGVAHFQRPDGRPLPAAPPAPAWAGPALGPTNDRLAVAGVEIDARTATPAWQGERLDLGWALSVLWRPRVERPTE